MPCPPRLIVSACSMVWYLSACKKINFIPSFFFNVLQSYPSLFFWYIEEILQSCYFGHAWLWPVKTVLPACRKLWCLSSCKKSNLSHPPFLKYFKDITKLSFWLRISKEKHQLVGNSCLPANWKSTWSFNFSEILHFKEFWNLIGQEYCGQ